MISGIYGIYNNYNEKYYIGQAQNIFSRFGQHKSLLKNNRHGNEYLQSAWNKYGYNCFDFIVIEECELEDMDVLEKYWIDFYDADNPECGYNLTSGGKSNSFLSNRTLEKIKSIWTPSMKKEVSSKMMNTKLNTFSFCKECNKKLKNGFQFYCEDHKVNCVKCKTRVPWIKRAMCEKCNYKEQLYNVCNNFSINRFGITFSEFTRTNYYNNNQDFIDLINFYNKWINIKFIYSPEPYENSSITWNDDSWEYSEFNYDN